jgi:hypothetical protein
MLDQAVDQSIGLPDAAEPAKQHDRAVTDARHGFGHRLHDLVDH